MWYKFDNDTYRLQPLKFFEFLKMAAAFNEKFDFSKDYDRAGNVLSIKNIVSVNETEVFVVNGCGHIGSIKFDTENSAICMTKFTKNKFGKIKFGSGKRKMESFDVGFDVEGNKGEIYQSRLVNVLDLKGRLVYFVDFYSILHNPNSGQKWPMVNRVKKEKTKKDKCFLKVLPWACLQNGEFWDNFMIGLSSTGIYKIKIEEPGFIKENSESYHSPQPSLRTETGKPVLRRNVSFSGIDKNDDFSENLGFKTDMGVCDSGHRSHFGSATNLFKSKSTEILFNTAEIFFPEDEFISQPLSRFSLMNILPENEMKEPDSDPSKSTLSNNQFSVNFYQPSFIEEYVSPKLESETSSDESESDLIRNLRENGAIPLPGLSFKGNAVQEVLQSIELFNRRKLSEYVEDGEGGRFELVI